MRVLGFGRRERQGNAPSEARYSNVGRSWRAISRACRRAKCGQGKTGGTDSVPRCQGGRTESRVQAKREGTILVESRLFDETREGKAQGWILERNASLICSFCWPLVGVWGVGGGRAGRGTGSDRDRMRVKMRGMCGRSRRMLIRGCIETHPGLPESEVSSPLVSGCAGTVSSHAHVTVGTV
jgi:hypothetical protein